MLAISCTTTTMAVTPGDVIGTLHKTAYPDARTAIWQDVKVTKTSGKTVTVAGTVGEQAQQQAIEQALRQAGYQPDTRALTVLQHQVPAQHRWAQVKLSIATLRTAPKHSAEIATQGLMGMPLKVLQEQGDWCRVQMPDDYIAWVPQNAIDYKTSRQCEAWRSATRYVVTVYDSRLVAQPLTDETVSDLVMGDILEYKGRSGSFVLLATPDGRCGYVSENEVAELGQWSQQGFDAALIEKTARRMMGSSYLWGGTSTKATDCSGLTKVCYLSNAIILQRDASQQALTGTIIKSMDWHQYQTGDLLFFGNSATGKVTHVGIYLRDGLFIHCSGQVKINSLDPQSTQYPYLYSPLSASRIQGRVGSKGIVAVRHHPWYFSQS